MREEGGERGERMARAVQRETKQAGETYSILYMVRVCIHICDNVPRRKLCESSFEKKSCQQDDNNFSYYFSSEFSWVLRS